MCGRYSVYDIAEIQTYFKRSAPSGFEPVYNAAPTMNLPILTDKEFVLARWGLIPPNAVDVNIGFKTINARLETIKEKPMFRQAFENNRCLVPANGFFEWKKTATIKIPNYITSDSFFVFAGIYETWKDMKTFSIITTDAEGEMKTIHDRMPLIIPKENAMDYLNKGVIPNPIKDFKIYKVSPKVNNVRYQEKDVITPLTTLGNF